MTAHWLAFLQGATGAVFVITAVTKTFSRTPMEPYLRAVGIRAAPARVLATAAAPTEALVGILLVAGIAPVAVGLAGAFLAVGFVLVHVRGLRSATTEMCRCFGVLDVETDARASLARAGLLVAAMVSVCALALHEATRAPGTADGTPLEMLVLGAASGVAVLLAFVLLGQVLRFEARRPQLVRPTPTTVGRGDA